MDLNELSFCMGLICFSLAVILGSCLVLCTKGRSFWLLGLVFGLGFLRFLLPVEFPHTRVICCWHVYPSIISLLWQELWPGLSLGRGLLILWCVGSVGDALPVGGHPVPAAPDCAAVPASSRGVAAPPAMLPGCPGGSVQQTSLCGNLLPGLHRDDGGIYKASDPAPAAIHAAACFAATLHSAS